MCCFMSRSGNTTYVGLARTIYIRCIYGFFGRGIIKYTVMYGAYIRFWTTLYMTVFLVIPPPKIHYRLTVYIFMMKLCYRI